MATACIIIVSASMASPNLRRSQARMAVLQVATLAVAPSTRTPWRGLEEALAWPTVELTVLRALLTMAMQSHTVQCSGPAIERAKLVS